MQLPATITAREPACRRVTMVAGVLVVLACAWRAIYRFDNGDFKLHWEFGRRILAGEFLYAGGHHATYPPFWAVAHSPFALVPMPVAKALFLPVGLGALVLLLWTLRKLVLPAIQPDRTRAFWAATVALSVRAIRKVRMMSLWHDINGGSAITKRRREGRKEQGNATRQEGS